MGIVTGLPTPRLRTLLSSAAAIVFATSLLVATPAQATASPAAPASTTSVSDVAAAAQPVKALVTDGFRAGNIISDSVFYDTSTMSAGAIDSFFRSKVSSCRSGYVCLKDYRQNTPNRGADKYCNGYQGAGNESAATIIYKVAQSCGINPQVFIVMLQKEQGLVTHTWPSDWRYTMALGQGCPDTAPCDPAFAGFFYQIYGAGRQMKIYTEGRYFTYYAPGKTWNILYNPNAACGRGPVYVENEATSALYYYTPYQPNAAALRAGYGEGDGCSAYGNRNFHNYFTDWFGSTQAPQASLITAAGTSDIFLVIGKQKRRVASWEDLMILSSRFGTFRYVSASYLNSLQTTGTVSRYIHDPRTGTLYLLQADGTKHPFPSVDLITRFGYAFSSYTNLEGAQVDAFRTGPAVGDYFRSDSSNDYKVWDAGTQRWIVNDLAWATQVARAENYVAVMPNPAAAAIPEGPALLAPGSLVREASATEVFLVGNGLNIAYVPSFALAADAGATAYRVVPDGALRGYAKAPAPLAPALVCGTQTYVVGGGRLTPLAAAIPGATSVPAAVCDALPRNTGSPLSKVFVKSPQGAPIYLLESGSELRHVRSGERLLALSGGVDVNPLSWSADTVSRMTMGAPILAVGSFVTVGGPELYYVGAAGALQHVTTTEAVLRLNSGRWPSIEALPAAFKPKYTFGDPIAR